MLDKQRNYGEWNPDELRKAEATASQFLAENGGEIAENIRAKAKFLEPLIQRLSAPRTSFHDRLEYLARISEICQLIQEEADGFFHLASQPMVARILGTLKP
jgi:hypothetical protein